MCTCGRLEHSSEESKPSSTSETAGRCLSLPRASTSASGTTRSSGGHKELMSIAWHSEPQKEGQYDPSDPWIIRITRSPSAARKAKIADWLNDTLEVSPTGLPKLSVVVEALRLYVPGAGNSSKLLTNYRLVTLFQFLIAGPDQNMVTKRP